MVNKQQMILSSKGLSACDTCYNMDEGPDYDSKENHVKCLEKRKL